MVNNPVVRRRLLPPWTVVFLGLIGLLWTGSAWAGGVLNPNGYNSWELYVFGNGTVVWNILNSVSAMVNDPGYHDLLEFVGVLGIFGAAIVGGFDASKMPKMLAFALGAFLVLYLSLDVTANIMVEDPVSGYTNEATGVPAVVGVPAAVVSDIGHWLTQKVEQDFSLPGDLTVSGGNGFDLTNALVQDATMAQILDPYLKQSIAAYFSNCVIPAMANGTVNASEILNSSDLWSTVQTTNGAVLTPVYSTATPNGALQSCSAAWTTIGNTMTAEAPTLLSSNANSWSNTNATNFLGNALTSSMAYLSNNGVSQSADQTLLNTAAINTMNSAFMQSAALAGNNGLMTSMAVAQAQQSQTSSWFTSARVFNDMMGYIYSVLQAFLFGVTPILMAALLIPGFGMTILKNFAQVLLWMILWQPLLAIVNFIIALYGQQSYGGVLAGAGGITDSNLPVISSESAHMVLAAGFLGTMVPIIAWGLVKGSLAFSDFIMSGVSSSFSNAAGGQAATGNVNLDNQSMNNDSFNSKNFAHSMSNGFDPMKSGDAMGVNFDQNAVSSYSMMTASGLDTVSGSVNQNTGSGRGTTDTNASGTSSSVTNGNQVANTRALDHTEQEAAQSVNAWSRNATTQQRQDYARQIGQDYAVQLSNILNSSASQQQKNEAVAQLGMDLKSSLGNLLDGAGLGAAGGAEDAETAAPALSKAQAAEKGGLLSSVESGFRSAEASISKMSTGEKIAAVAGLAVASVAVGLVAAPELAVAGIVGEGATALSGEGLAEGATDLSAEALGDAPEAVSGEASTGASSESGEASGTEPAQDTGKLPKKELTPQEKAGRWLGAALVGGMGVKGISSVSNNADQGASQAANGSSKLDSSGKSTLSKVAATAFELKAALQVQKSNARSYKTGESNTLSKQLTKLDTAANTYGTTETTTDSTGVTTGSSFLSTNGLSAAQENQDMGFLNAQPQKTPEEVAEEEKRNAGKTRAEEQQNAGQVAAATVGVDKGSDNLRGAPGSSPIGGPSIQGSANTLANMNTARKSLQARMQKTGAALERAQAQVKTDEQNLAGLTKQQIAAGDRKADAGLLKAAENSVTVLANEQSTEQAQMASIMSRASAMQNAGMVSAQSLGGVQNHWSQILKAANEYGVSPADLGAIMYRESGGHQHNAEGGILTPIGETATAASARGLMQVEPGSAPGVNLNNPQSNIDAGAQILKENQNLFGDNDMAVLGYTVGAGALMTDMAELGGTVGLNYTAQQLEQDPQARQQMTQAFLSNPKAMSGLLQKAGREDYLTVFNQAKASLSS